MKNFKGIFYALLSSCTFGLIPLCTLPLLAGGMGSPSVLFYRFLLAAGIMGLVTKAAGHSLRVSFRQLGTLSLLGLLYAVTALGLIKSYTLIPSGVATTIHFLYPMVVTLIMVVLYKETKSILLFLSAFIALAGVGLMSWSGGGLNPRGILLVLFTVVTYSAYIVGVNKSGVEKTGAMALTFYMLAAGAILFAGYALLTTGIEAVPDAGAWRNLLLLAVIPTVISDMTLVYAVKYAGSTTASLLGSLEPVTAVMVGALYFAEPFSAGSFLGMTLIVLSVVLVILRQKKNRQTVHS